MTAYDSHLPSKSPRRSLQQMRKYISTFAFAAPLVFAACTPNDSGSTSTTCSALTPTKAVVPAGWSGTVFTIVMENHSRGDILGNKDAPFINQLAKANAVAAGYHDSFVHPSEPNYLWMVAGENFGVLDDNDPTSHHLDSTSHIADQIEDAGLTWKSYQESMGDAVRADARTAATPRSTTRSSTSTTSTAGTAPRSIRRRAATTTSSTTRSSTPTSRRNALPEYVFITPNLDDDMHDGSIAQGDAWLPREVPKLLATDAYKNGGVIFLLWDEGGGSPAGDDPPFIAISPQREAAASSRRSTTTRART